MKGKHTQGSAGRSRWRRRIIGLPVWGWLVAMLTAGVAVAAIVVTLGGSGTFNYNVAANNAITFNAVQADGTTPHCTASKLNDTTFQVTAWTGFGPNEPTNRCRIGMKFNNTGNTSLYLAELKSADQYLRFHRDPGAGGEACGLQLAAGASSTGWFYTDITVKPTIADGAPGMRTVDISKLSIEWGDAVGDVKDCDSNTP